MTINTNLYLDLYVLQSVPPSNLNRGVDGAPKSAMFGGFKRTRVSSQSWKHAMRTYFATHHQPNSNRTVHVPEMLAHALQALDPALDYEDALDKAEETLKAAKITGIAKDHTTKAMLSVTSAQIEAVARYASTTSKLDKKELQTLLLGDRTLDLELFGRMVADNQELTIDGVSQVAHAISVNAVSPEFDYFVAMDDLQPEDQQGAFKIGETEYNSSTLYRYANLNLHQLIADLGPEVAVQGMKDFVQAFILSMPTGKQNSYANKTLPSYIMAVLRTDTPVNLVNAYEAPVEVDDNGYLKESVDRLQTAYRKAQKLTDKPLYRVALALDEQVESDADAANLTDLTVQLAAKINEVTGDEISND